MSAGEDADFMRAALGLARRGLGQVWPNPAVGCVIVAGGRVVGRGRTAPGGRPHAETAALAMAGAAARGATAYVTLEPCAHHGRTPPCAEALVAAGVARVVVALGDPDPRVNGRGIAILRAGGITVETGCLADAAAEVNRGFLSRVVRGRPALTLKLATSLDGRIATATGESRWITGPRARAEVHLLRARADAVMVGAATMRADNPRLDVRGGGLEAAQPIRVVVAGREALPRDGYLGRSAGAHPLWICHPEGMDLDWWRAAGATLIPVAPGPEGRPEPAALLRALGALGLTRVLCEGGGKLAAALLGAGQVDEIIAYGAGLTLGADGRPAIGPLGLAALADAPRFVLVDAACVDGDIRIRWRSPETGTRSRGREP